jgi:hypothetical protein
MDWVASHGHLDVVRFLRQVRQLPAVIT